MAKHADTLIKANGLEGRIVVINSVGRFTAAERAESCGFLRSIVRVCSR